MGAGTKGDLYTLLGHAKRLTLCLTTVKGRDTFRGMPCRRCIERGPLPESYEPREGKCAFSGGYFGGDNWNCATMNALRDLVGNRYVYDDDQSCAVIPIVGTGNFVIIGWYKRRGATESAMLLGDSEAGGRSVSSLTEGAADECIRSHG